MTDPVAPDPNERSFSDLLAPGLKELRQQRGFCPSSEDLVAFFEGQLRPGDASRVRNHVEACGLCDVQLGRLEAAQEPVRPMLLEGIWVFLRKPVVAYALVALLAFPAYRGLFHVPKDTERKPIPSPRPEPRFGVRSVPNFSLDVVRSASPRNSRLLHLSGDEPFFVLSFLVPMKASPPYQYDFVIVRDDGTGVIPTQPLRHCDGMGNCLLFCDSALFSTAGYELRVTEREPDGSKTVRPFPFQIAR